jgi:hypothetical protein
LAHPEQRTPKLHLVADERVERTGLFFRFRHSSNILVSALDLKPTFALTKRQM